jgi:hypothetical protein
MYVCIPNTAPTFHSNSGTRLPGTECHITGGFILKTVQHLHPDNGKLENVEYFNYLCSMTTNDARCTRESKSRIVMAKAAFNKKNTLFTSKSDLN